MIRKFLKDVRGNYMIATVVAVVPIMGALALAIDYTEMNRERQAMLNALDAANLAAGRRIQSGASDADVLTYTKQFFEINLGSVDPKDTTLTTILPSNNAGGGTLKSTACLNYKPYFYPAFAMLLDSNATSGNTITFCADSEVRLKNTLEVALVLDNSGSMDYLGSGSGKKRLVLLKDAAKQLVDTIAGQAGMMKQVSKPVQFGVVPFAASVNVGPDNATASWMDTTGLSPVHYENFNVSTSTPVTIDADRQIKFSSGHYRKIGSGWGSEENKIFTRFTLYNDLQRITGKTQVKTGTEYTCIEKYWWGGCKTWGYKDVYKDVDTYGSFTSWQGCVEARPHPYNTDNTTPNNTNPATLFVPMFAPDETDLTDGSGRVAYNNWWDDNSTTTGTTTSVNQTRQKSLAKYYKAAPQGTGTMSKDEGPNLSCTVTAITPLTDVTVAAGLTKIKGAIDAMVANGATNVPEGMAWGWRTVSGSEPFTQGRADTEKGNDKVVIVLTDGENTYYTPDSLSPKPYSGSSSRANDLAANRSIYSAHAYAGSGRLFSGTSVSTSYTNANYTTAMNQHFDTLCTNAKTSKIIVMTVALDLSSSDTEQKKQIEALKKCSSDSRYRRDSTDPSKPAKLFWNTTGGNLADTFKEIADELSNLRIVG